MDIITLNGRTADITLESEKTLGELLEGIDSWLEGSGRFLSGIEIDGKVYGSSALNSVFDMELAGISRVDIRTASRAELLLEALLGIKNDLEFLASSTSGSLRESPDTWKKTIEAAFLRQNAADIYTMVLQILGGSLSPAAALSVINERIREIQSPPLEIKASIPHVEEISRRLEDLPLDVQTGKDARAAETIALFTGITEKLFRLLLLIRQYGVDTESLRAFLDEFGAAVKELHAACENRDTVLAGDLAEYELAPRLLELSSRLGKLASSLEAA